MPNTKSAKRAMRGSQRKNEVNKPRRSKVRTAVKIARTALAAKTVVVAEATVVIRDAQSALDHAVTQGIMHRNAAARRKSRLQRQLNKATQA